MDHDPGQPGAKTGTSLKLAKVPQRMQMRFLNRILDFGVVPQNSINHSLEAAPVAACENLVRCGISPAHPFDHFFVRQGRRNRRPVDDFVV